MILTSRTNFLLHQLLSESKKESKLTPKAKKIPYMTAKPAIEPVLVSDGTSLLYAPLRANPNMACIHNPKIMQYWDQLPVLVEPEKERVIGKANLWSEVIDDEGSNQCSRLQSASRQKRDVRYKKCWWDIPIQSKCRVYLWYRLRRWWSSSKVRMGKWSNLEWVGFLGIFIFTGDLP